MTEALSAVYKAGKIVFAIGGKVVGDYNYFKDLESIQRQITEVYFDISRSHLTSAKESLLAATHSANNTTGEILAAIHHLYDAYNTINGLLGKTKTKKILFFKYEENIVDDPQKIYKSCLEISLLVHFFYCLLGEKDNAADWKAKVFINFKYRLKDENDKLGTYHFNDEEKQSIEENIYENLRKISPEYVDKYEWEETEYKYYLPDYGDVYETYNYVKYYITESGQKYCNDHEIQFIKKLLKQIVDADILLADINEECANLKKVMGEDSTAFYNMALIYETMSPDWAYYFFYVAGLSGSIEAQKHLAQESLKEDQYGAIAWLEKAAENNDADSQYALGMHYLKESENYRWQDKSAFDWLEKAAKNNHAQAQYEVGLLYYSGMNLDECPCRRVEKSDEQARFWLQQSYNNGFQLAYDKMQKLNLL